MNLLCLIDSLGSNHFGRDGDRDMDVAACSAGMRANLVRSTHQGFGSSLPHAGRADIETGGEAENAVRQLDVQAAIRAVGRPVPARRGVGYGGIQNCFDFCHDGFVFMKLFLA